MSENHNISSLFDRSGNLSRETMERYLRGQLSDSELEGIERYLEDSPFDREALEGLMKQQKGNFRGELDELDARITAKARERARIPQLTRIKSYYWAAAAGLAALVGLTVLLVFMFRSPSEQQLAVSGQRSAVSNQDSGTWNSGTLEQLAIDNAQPVGGIAVVEDDAEISEDIQPVVVADNMEMENEDADVSKDIETKQMDEGQALNEVVVTKKRTGASKKAMSEMALEVNGAANPDEDTLKGENNIFLVVESMPEFPGGEDAFIKYLADSLRYPTAAIENSIQGRVFVTFVVEKDGSISDARILRGIGGGCDEEALRVIQNMPKWIPGKQRGKPVRVQCNLPIKFSPSDTSD